MTKEECEIETSKAIMEMRRHIAELEQEIVALKKDKEDLIFIRNQKAKCTCEDKEKLTQAKKIIGNLYAMCKDNHYPGSSVLMEQAEQFLKETADIREDSTLDGDWVVDEH